jgi:hypothetical protein
MRHFIRPKFDGRGEKGTKAGAIGEEKTKTSIYGCGGWGIG